MNKTIRTFLNGLLALVLLVSITMVLRQLLDNSNGSSVYDDALQIALSGDTGTVSPEKTEETESAEARERHQWIPAPIEDADVHMQALEELNLDSLREINPDVLGWILIPDTQINYPILQGEDNDFYLEHTWERTKNSVGSIFLEHRNTPDLTDFNTIVYGHNMNDGSMFADIKYYRGMQYWQQHPYVYIRTDAGVFRYEVFSAYQTEITSSAYGLSFNQGETRANFLVEALKESRIDTEILPELTDRILTLSTCSGTGYSDRWVVHARLKMMQVEPG